MKKILAIVLTVAMLLSMVAVGINAAREVTDNSYENHYWNFPEGSSYAPIDLGNQSEIVTVQMDIRLDTDSSGISNQWGLCNNPVINTTSLGVNGATIPATFEVGEWYNVKWEAADGKTILYVDGTNVGEVAGNVTVYQNFASYFTWDKISVDNLAIGTYFNDMEDGGLGLNADGNQCQGQLVAQTVEQFANDNVGYGENHYWNFPEGSSYAPIDLGDQSEIVTVQMDIRLDTDSSGISNQWGLCNNPVINTTSLGVNGATIPATFEVGEWYNVKWEAADGKTILYVDGANVGEVAGNVTVYQNFASYFTWDKISVDNLTIGTYSNDMEDGGLGLNADGNQCQGQLVAEDVETGRWALGKYYWNFPEGSSYAPVDLGTQSAGFDVEMDLCLDTDTSGISNQFGLCTNPVINTTSVGINGATIPASFEVGTWYHVKWDAVDGNTVIYVDGVKIGQVAGNITLHNNKNAYFTWDKLSIDNLTIGTYSNDMEDGGLGLNADGNQCQGQLVEYVMVNESIFDHISVGTPGGEAYVIIPNYGAENVYTDISGINPGSGNFILNFDLALVPYVNGDDGVMFEMWTNTASRRWQVGETFTGVKDGDKAYYTGFEWGELTKDNFHNITYVMDQDHLNGQIWVDQVMVYEGNCGTPWADRFLGMVWNASAILDNVKLYDLDYNEKHINLADNSISGVLRTVDLDAAVWCDTNTHLPEADDFIVPEGGKCTETTTCHYCDEYYFYQEIAEEEHKWCNLNQAYVNGDKKVYYCQNGACTASFTDIFPTEDKYTGTLNTFISFDEPRVLDYIETDFFDLDYAEGGQYIADGKAIIDNCTNTYYQFYTNAPSNVSWAVSFDASFEGIWDAEAATTGGYGHRFNFWFGGSNGMMNEAGYDFDRGCWFIRPFSGSAYDEVTFYEKLPVGEVHNFTFRFYAPGEDAYWEGDTNFCSIEIDGEEKVRLQDDDYTWAFSSLAGEKANLIIIRNFGVNATIDNFAVGSHDFAWVPEVPDAGDVNGDGRIGAKDVLLLKKILSGAYIPGGYDEATADVNGDGRVNVLDMAAIKAIMVG